MEFWPKKKKIEGKDIRTHKRKIVHSSYVAREHHHLIQFENGHFSMNGEYFCVRMCEDVCVYAPGALMCNSCFLYCFFLFIFFPFRFNIDYPSIYFYCLSVIVYKIEKTLCLYANDCERESESTTTTYHIVCEIGNKINIYTHTYGQVHI